MSVSPRSINDMSDRTYHHHDSTKAASTFMLDAPPADPPTPVAHFVQDAPCDVTEEKTTTMKKRNRPYLILDIRDVEDYKKGRIATSKSYPFPRLCRSVNYETKDMLKYKNVTGKLIIGKFCPQEGAACEIPVPSK